MTTVAHETLVPLGFCRGRASHLRRSARHTWAVADLPAAHEELQPLDDGARSCTTAPTGGGSGGRRRGGCRGWIAGSSPVEDGPARYGRRVLIVTVLAVIVAVAALAWALTLHRSLGAVRTELTATAARAEGAERRADDLEAANRSAAAEADGVRASLAEAQVDAVTRRRELATAREEIATAGDELEAGRRSHAADRDALAGEQEALAGQRQQLAADRDELEADRKELAGQRNEVDAASNEVATGRRDLETARHEVEDERRSVDARQQRLARHGDAGAPDRPHHDQSGAGDAGRWALLIAGIEREWAAAVGATPSERGTPGSVDDQFAQALGRELERLREVVGLHTEAAVAGSLGELDPVDVLLVATEVLAVLAPHVEHLGVELGEGVVMVVGGGWTGDGDRLAHLGPAAAATRVACVVEAAGDNVRITLAPAPAPATTQATSTTPDMPFS